MFTLNPFPFTRESTSSIPYLVIPEPLLLDRESSKEVGVLFLRICFFYDVNRQPKLKSNRISLLYMNLTCNEKEMIWVI